MSTSRKSSTSKPSSHGLTVEQFCNYVAPATWDKTELLEWPPDVFALVASLLLKSGAYCYAVSGWKRKPSLNAWTKRMTRYGQQWHANSKEPPSRVRQLHRRLTTKRNRQVTVSSLRDHPKLCEALLELCAVADEACSGAGFGMSKKGDLFMDRASKRLFLSGEALGASTLCERVDHSAVRVLPKLHTPQSGITLRSLSHHVALCPAGDVKAKWAEYPCARRHYFNLLLAPWPLTSNPAHFQAVEPTKAELLDLPPDFGFFEYNPPADAEVLRRLKALLKHAQKIVAKVHGVIFPELALTKDQYARISTTLMKQDIFLICGVREPPSPKSKAARNYLQFDIPSAIGPTWHQQSKHHRWRLDRRQIVQYGLGSCLNVTGNWWEHISVGGRNLYFVALDDWFTVCALICEDLARQDPVGEIVRAVGPNLVIALLMDGPQLTSRWPARYATVLADDPGCSVLTLTSVGMSELSRPPSIQDRSRAVALWKDAKTGEAFSIELPEKKEGVILSLSRDRENEWTADGREDGGTTGYPTLSGIHFV